MSRGEFDIIRDYFRRRAGQREDLLLGIGDDGAVVKAAGELAWVVDTINSGVHFPEDAPAHVVGHRVLAVNLSDMVAMGADPRWALLALTLPVAEEAWLDDFCDGFFRLAGEAGCVLAGGDLTRGPLAATVTLLGPLHGRAVTRAGARVGDDILVSGTLGDARAGLDIALGDGAPADGAEAFLLNRYLYPAPRLALAPLLPRYAHAALDLSDGLCADLSHMLEASGVGAELSLAELPLSEALAAHAPEEARRLALAGGDDYEIVCAVDPGQREAFMAAAAAAGVSLTRIGRVTDDKELRVLDEAGEPEPLPGSFRHFGDHDA
ncbi:thiamine-phosphate kinase [Natronospira bacteriovora]|uniref:Thiamine-monophosphate kinase n=1 Tax=Natronospira bacteriovora TaxID=3069753 RepID=A0ABU0W3Q6_9GAMM|nr:thiamine-phosphate kinase [Natronospira sp. AB-CW4]MDQ2068543.1 thiamine-phosphate kinase [Natronospira sp. AB-CW4]